MARYVKRDYFKMQPMEVYKLVAKGKLTKFPNNYLSQEIVSEIMRSVFLKQLHYTREDICTKINYPLLKEYYLGGARKLFGSSIANMIIYCFAEMNIYPWELPKVNGSFWKDEENRRNFMQYVIKQEKTDLDSIVSVRAITAKVIYKYGGSKALLYGDGMTGLIFLVTGNRYKEWQVGKVSAWNKEKVIEAVKWLVEEKLCYSEDEVCLKLIQQDFIDNNLEGMLAKACNHSILQALNTAYPGVYHRNIRNHMYHI